jgi:hypothetical protein
LVTSTTKPTSLHHTQLQASRLLRTNGNSQHDGHLQRENGGSTVQNGGRHHMSTGADDKEKNLYAAVRGCVNPDTFNDLLRLAGRNSTNGGNGITENVWRKGSLDSANDCHRSPNGDISHQPRKSSAPSDATTAGDNSAAVLLRSLIRWTIMSTVFVVTVVIL